MFNVQSAMRRSGPLGLLVGGLWATLGCSAELGPDGGLGGASVGDQGTGGHLGTVGPSETGGTNPTDDPAGWNTEWEISYEYCTSRQDDPGQVVDDISECRVDGFCEEYFQGGYCTGYPCPEGRIREPEGGDCLDDGLGGEGGTGGAWSAP